MAEHVAERDSEQSIDELLKNLESEISRAANEDDDTPESERERQQLIAKSKILSHEVGKSNRMDPKTAEAINETPGQMQNQFPESTQTLPPKAQQLNQNSMDAMFQNQMSSVLQQTQSYTTTMMTDWSVKLIIGSFIVPVFSIIWKTTTYTFYHLLSKIGISWGKKQVQLNHAEELATRREEEAKLDLADPQGAKSRPPIEKRISTNPSVANMLGNLMSWGILGAAIATLIYLTYKATMKFIESRKKKKEKEKLKQQQTNQNPKQITENAVEILRLENLLEVFETCIISEISEPKLETKKDLPSYIIKKISDGEKSLAALATATEYGARTDTLYPGFIKANHVFISMGITCLNRAKGAMSKIASLKSNSRA